MGPSCSVGASDASRALHGHGRAIRLTTIFDVHHTALCEMTCGAHEGVMRDATDSSGLVRDHVAQDQLTATRSTTHHSHTKSHA
jgi:hypothetical protein